ncbi:MAG: hypothetical protein A2927_01920 [Candidatus Komeilibacteria bacterium RIFCSPLOWO2_01_FULL_45_10]|uniref:Glycosyltransferase 2-like domain-containing protein n=1 Tax=Candidatus Komeilibacteria bacterium RIFCSPLOWO2_01_FULL_45_10 TaxID=1798550 RepID=A0A1G2BK55_9BACT|nr:MAG: hypothetical protein A2927_01920 [Candidatus Komeilibacteria bacterium RIFCSPLOWO2_01_FULL_45_10]
MKKLSVIIPVYNEAENVGPLYGELKQVLAGIMAEPEIIFINDGSSDNTLEKLKELSNVKIVNFRKNYGQTASLQAGFDLAEGDVIVSLDGDGQNDPADIPLLLAKLNEGYDVVCGWRWQRHDSFLKKFVSGGANFLRKIFVKDNVHDSGCTLRAYRQEAVKSLELSGELHRFIPALVQLNGFKVTELKVNHRPRLQGVTKYSYGRVLKGLIDIISVWFWRKYAGRPLHLFGGIGLILIMAGLVLGLYLFIARLLGYLTLSDKIWPLVDVLMILSGIQLFVSGIIADIAVKGFDRSSRKKPYAIKEIIEQ